jgi:ferredoxin-NADP reductase
LLFLTRYSMTTKDTLQAWVHTLRHEAQDIISVELRPAAGTVWPAFTPGAHIDLHLPGGLVRSYSLCNPAADTQRYVIGVLKDKASRGGSRAVHDLLRVGMALTISAPRNHFPLVEDAAHSVLVAGGIGITPLLCMARRLSSLGRSYEVLYFARNRAAAAFADVLQELGAKVHWHFDAEAGGPPDLRALLAARRAQDTHYYACGPTPMLDAFEADCQALGLSHAHLERFSAKPVEAASDARSSYSVELRRSGITFEVPAGKTLHKKLIELKIDVPWSCEEGICGSCETRVLEGQVDHRDMVLTPAEQADNKVMMVCVSGCKSERLVLDL